MKFKSSCLVHALFCFKLFLLSIAQDQFEYSMVLGNCTDISKAIDMKNLKLVENLDNKNLRKYFYDNYEYGYINITDVYSIGGSENTHHKIEYFNTISSVRMFSNIDARLFYIENWSNIFEESEDTLFIAFGRSTDNTSAEYDIILKLDKSSIRTTSSDNTEFEIEYLDFKLSYRTVTQNCVNDISVQDGKLIMKTNESIYPLINFSIFINNSIEAKHFTYIEIGMIQGYPSISSFIYYPLAILYGLSIFYFLYSLMDSSIRFMFKVNNLFQLTLFYFHCYYVLMVTKLIFTYILEYYSYFKFMKFLSIIASFGGVLITIFIVTQLIQYCRICKSNECLIIILFITLYILAFYFFLFGYFCQYVIQNLWIYAILTNVWVLKFCINFICKLRISQIWIFCIPISVIICCFQLQIFNVYASEIHYNIYYVIILLIFHLLFIALVGLQENKGSRFFLPDRMRVRMYEKLLKSVDTQEHEENLICQICMNPVDQPELEYSDNNPNYKWVRFSIGEYIRTECSHIFHPNCILKSITLDSSCPVCLYYVNINDFDD